ncbi:unnamed protein product [Amoebophrya sp. A25]|nr:unnamed protein product [Amoebophrya sp. A25]|eukprot:GSA25T00021841001.1
MKQDSQSKEANIKHQATSSTSTSTTSRKNPHLLPGVTDTAASSIPASSKKVNGTIGKASSKGTTSKMSKNPQAHEDEHEQFKGSAAFAVMLVRDQPDYSTKASRGPKKHDPKRITSEAHMEGAGLLNERAFLHGRGMLVPPVGIHLDKAVKGEELDHRGHAYHECASPFYMPNVSEEQKQEWRRIVEENKHFLQDFQQEVELAEDIKQRRGQLETEDVVGLGGIGRGGRSSPSKSKNLASATPNTRSVDQEEVDDDTEDARLQAVEEVGTSSSGEDSGTHVKIGHVAMHKKDFTETLKRHIRPKSSTPSPNRKNKTDQEVDDLKSTSDVLSITGRGVLEERAEQENGVGDDVSVRSGGISPRAIEAKWRKSGASVLPLLDELEKEDDPGDLREKILLPTSPLFRRELFKKAHKVLQKVKLRQHVAAYEQQENVKYTRLFMTCVKELALTRAREKEQERWRQELLQEEAERREQELANGNASGAAVVGSTNRSKNTTPGGSGAAVLPRGDRSRSPSPHAAVGGGSLGASTTSTHIHHGHHHGHHKHVKTSEQQEDAAEGRANRRSKERVSLLAEYQDELDGLEAITVTPRGGTHVVDIEAAKRIHRSLSADQSLKKLAEAAKQTEEYKLRKMSQQHQKEHGLLQNGSGAFQPAQRSVLLGQNMNLGSLVPALKSAAGQSGFLATKALASRTGVAGAPSSMMQLQQEDGQNNIFSPVTSKETVSNAGSPGGSREVVDTEDTFTVSNPLLIMKDSLDPVNKGAAKKNLGNGLVPFPKKLDMPGGVGISTKTAAGATTEVPSLQDHIRMNKFISVKSTSQNCGGALAPTSAARLQLNLGDLGLGRGGAGIASSNVSILGNSVGVVPGSGPVIAENNMSMMPVSAPVSARGERHVVPITGAGTLTPMLKPLPLFATPQPTAFKTAAQAEAPLRSSSPSSANQQGKKDADRSSSTTRRLLLLDQKLEANFESFMPQGSPFAKAGAGQRSAQNDSMQLGASASTASLQPGSGSMTAFLSNAYMRAKNEAAGKSASARGAALEGQQQRDKTASSAMSSARAPTLLRADSFRNDLSARGRGLSINRLDPGQAPGVSTDPFRGQVIAGTICKVNVTSTSPGSGHHGVTTTSFSPQTSKLLFTKLPGDEGMKDIKDKFQKVMSGLTQPIVPNWTGEAPSS